MTGGSGSKKRSRRKLKRVRKPNPATQLTDDLLVEILSRVPYRSLCRFRCVSTRWYVLISHPDYQKRLPQTLAGFFHQSHIAPGVRCRYCFTNMSGTGRPLMDPSFPFLPDRQRKHLTLVDSCSGLILGHNILCIKEKRFYYIVVNPATEEWVAVPVPWRGLRPGHSVHLGFDPAFSSHFYIFEFPFDVVDDNNAGGGHNALGVKIYSSETGVWCHKQSGWSFGIKPQYAFKKSVFVNGMLYVLTFRPVIGAVDVKGETWRTIDFPRCELFFGFVPGFIDLSQGRLHFANDNDVKGDKLAIWVLEDKDTDEWILKHTICYKHLLGMDYVRHFGLHEFQAVAIHPDRNMVFFVVGGAKKKTNVL